MKLEALKVIKKHYFSKNHGEETKLVKIAVLCTDRELATVMNFLNANTTVNKKDGNV